MKAELEGAKALKKKKKKNFKEAGFSFGYLAAVLSIY